MKLRLISHLFFLFVVFGILFPFKFVFAVGYCACYSKDQNCLPAILAEADQTNKACEAACQKQTEPKYKSHTFEPEKIKSKPNAKAEKLQIECNKQQKTFEENEKKKAEADAEKKAFIEPKLNVQVPELTFSKTLFGPCSYDPSQKCVQSSTLGDYINALYKFLLNSSILIAIVMIMIGGLQYVLGAASEAQVNKGKERMTNAVTGLVLLLCVFLILKNVNPQLVSLKMVQLQNIPEEGLGNNEVTDLSDANASYPPVTITAGQLPKFKQCGSEWKNIPYKGVNGATVICGPSKHVNANHEDNICESGCGPVSVAVVLGYYGQNVSPPIVANYASEIGAHAACTSGTNVNLLCNKIPAKWSNMTCKGISPNDTKAIANYLTQKKPIVFSCAGCTGKKADGSDQKYRGHFMVLTGVSGNHFTVFDVGKQNGITTIPMSEFTSGKVKSSYLIQKK